jgi:hypothetical protein
MPSTRTMDSYTLLWGSKYGLCHAGPDQSLVRDMTAHLADAQSGVEDLLKVGRDNAPLSQMQKLGLGTSKFTFSVCRLLRVLLEIA